MVCGPLAGREIAAAGVGVNVGAGEVVLWGLLAMAEVERKTKGLRSSFPDAWTAADEGLSCSGFSDDFVIPEPLVCAGNFGTLGEDFEADCDRCRASFDTASFRLSTLFVDRCPGVWLLEGVAVSRVGIASSGMSGGRCVSDGPSWIIFCDRTSFDLLGERALSTVFC